MKISSTDLTKLIIAVKEELIEKPANLPGIKLSLEGLLAYLATPEGRTDINCKETEWVFALHDENRFSWEHLPVEYQLIIDDISMQLHDSISAPEIAENFESTPEQLLERIRKL